MVDENPDHIYLHFVLQNVGIISLKTERKQQQEQ